MKKIVTLGILGGVGGGKSTVAKMFEKLGANIIDADKIAHDFIQKEKIKNRIVNIWGTDILNDNDEIDRKRLGQKIFQDKSEVEKLNELLHPLISKEIISVIERIKEKGDEALIVVDAALLAESEIKNICDKFIYVRTPFNIRKERVEKKRGWDSDEINKRELFQMKLKKKEELADYIIENDKSEDLTFKQVEKIFERIMGKK